MLRRRSMAEEMNAAGNKIRWRLGVLAALAITLLSLYPQIDLWRTQKTSAYATLEFDEVAYSAYLNALIEGRSRRNDPYLGASDSPTTPQPETLFSVQFLPPYFLALPARILHLDASQVFIIIAPLAALAAALALFWLLKTATDDERIAAAGVLIVLCFGSIAGTPLALKMIARGHLPFTYLPFLPFLRRYVPAVPFPLFLIFCGLVWRMFTSDKRAALLSAVAAGVTFALLVFSYFYLWTAALAWFACACALWVVAHKSKWRQTIASVMIVAAFMIASIIPYARLLSKRAANTDTMVLLRSLHAPDLVRLAELIGGLCLVMLIVSAWRGRMDWRNSRWLFAASFALMPFAVFNQQVITGISLQPAHYEKLIANYCVLISFVVTVDLLWRGLNFHRRIPAKILGAASIIAFCWCAAETVTQTARNRSINAARADERLVAERLRQLSIDKTASANQRETVLFAPELLRVHADSLPTDTAQPPFWAPHTFVFTTSWPEYKERLYQNLFYTGVDEAKLNALIENKDNLIKFIFLSHQAKPITPDTIPQEVTRYLAYRETFAGSQSARTTIGYLITSANSEPDLTNLDRSYVRDAGEQIGNLKIYRLRPRL